MLAEVNSIHDEKLATEFVTDRLRHFTKLHKPVKKLVLGVVSYYLDTFFSYHDDAVSIVKAIQQSSQHEADMVSLYQQFLEFLPVRLRSGIQGRYLFREPSMEEKQANDSRLEAKVGALPDLDAKQIMEDLGLTAEQFNEMKSMLPDSHASSAENQQVASDILSKVLDINLSPDEIGKIIQENGLDKLVEGYHA
jgi:hypothetical protein